MWKAGFAKHLYLFMGLSQSIPSLPSLKLLLKLGFHSFVFILIIKSPTNKNKWKKNKKIKLLFFFKLIMLIVMFKLLKFIWFILLKFILTIVWHLYQVRVLQRTVHIKYREIYLRDDLLQELTLVIGSWGPRISHPQAENQESQWWKSV